MGRSSNLSNEQQIEAVLSVIRKEEPVTTIARRYQVSVPTLTKWRDQFLQAGQAALAQGGSGAEKQIRHLKDELATRDQVIGELTVANRILKKNGTA